MPKNASIMVYRTEQAIRDVARVLFSSGLRGRVGRGFQKTVHLRAKWYIHCKNTLHIDLSLLRNPYRFGIRAFKVVDVKSSVRNGSFVIWARPAGTSISGIPL